MKRGTAKTEERAKELATEAMKVELKTTEELKPWEQHSAVITIPRFDYNASSSLLSHSHSGFLITCPISKASHPISSVQKVMFFFFLVIFVLYWYLFM
ncbi:unnamed protein product [Coffea canephora]|uniref:DH200=94 genomic scaffold, scaffold_12762 n=1 Tax=Coffea canephora TaxID=49390 RepID=A0A068VNJ5_COFCA|nr:unnamed protein product [Coffea canephora]